MQIGMIGLGKMGANMVQRLQGGGHRCVVYDKNEAAVRDLTELGAVPAGSLSQLVDELAPPRCVWIMVPDTVVDQVVEELADLLQRDDVIIDGGNSYFPDDVQRAKSLAARGIEYIDVGTSGGVWGLEKGYCLMIGGNAEPVALLQPVFETLAPGINAASKTAGRTETSSSAEQGYLHCGGHGAGHFVKMVHNGIEYGLMAAYAEGFAMMDKAAHMEDAPVPLNAGVGEIAELWRRGSVVGSWLLDLAAGSLHKDPSLSGFSSSVSDSGEGRWTVKTATDMGIPVHVLTAALYQRFSSRGEANFANKVLSAMRKAFGGHLE
jgi:6-phosphogluconate dehydrogenase